MRQVGRLRDLASRAGRHGPPRSRPGAWSGHQRVALVDVEIPPGQQVVRAEDHQQDPAPRNPPLTHTVSVPAMAYASDASSAEPM